MQRIKDYKMLRVVLRLLFTAYTFLFLFVFQRDVIETFLLQFNSMASNLSRCIFVAVMLTLVANFLEIPVRLLFKSKGHYASFNYLPSALLVGLVTSLGMMGELSRYATHAFVLSLLICLFLFLSKVLSSTVEREHGPYKVIYSNLVGMVLTLMVMTLAGVSDEVTLRELRIKRLYSERRYEKVLALAPKAEEISSTVSLYRAKSLLEIPYSVPGSGVGESLFDYMQSAPALVADSLLSLEREDSTVKGCAVLSALLLKKDLEGFLSHFLHAGEGVSIKTWDRSTIPRYYLQALILADHNSLPECDSLLLPLHEQRYMEEKALFEEYLEHKAEVSGLTSTEKRNSMFKAYARTYYWFYDFFD